MGERGRPSQRQPSETPEADKARLKELFTGDNPLLDKAYLRDSYAQVQRLDGQGRQAVETELAQNLAALGIEPERKASASHRR